MTTQELIKSLGGCAIVSLWNRYVEENDLDERIYLNISSEINKAFSTPYDVALAMSHGDWYPTDTHFFFDRFGNLISFDSWDDVQSPIDIDLLAGFVENEAL